MRVDRPVRVGVFRSRADAVRVAQEARRVGFNQVRVLCGGRPVSFRFDPGELPGRVESLTPVTLPRSARRLPLEVALLGALCGFLAAWALGATGLLEPLFAYVALPAAGFVFFGLVGAMLTRGFTREADEFYDQDLEGDEYVVAIEDEDPERLALAVQLLAAAGAEPLPLVEG